MKTLKRQDTRRQHKSKHSKSKKLHNKNNTYRGGGFFGTSYDDKIIKHLKTLNAISDDQGKQILSAANKGNNKKAKIELFVDQCVIILIDNLSNIWKTMQADIRKKPEFKSIAIILDKPIPTQKENKYILIQELHKEYDKLPKPTKDSLNAELGKIRLASGVNGTTLFPILYNLNEKWIKTETLKTLAEPKFADLYEKWFDIAHKGWADRHKWLLLFS